MAREVSRGDIGSLILAVLAEGKCHGYALAREVERRSADALKMREGSLYPALRVLEADELIVGEWEEGTGGPARRVYSITAKGTAELAKRAKDWRAYVEAVGSFLGGANEQRA
jgi:PadR family transcriptional regulator PadR